MLIGAYALIFVAMFIVAYQFFKVGGQGQRGRLLPSAGVSQSLILKLCLPIIRTYLLPSIESFRIDNFRKTVKLKITQSGMVGELSPDEYIGMKVLLVFALPLVAFTYNLTLNVGNPLILILAFGIGGYFFPDIWIRGLITDRHTKIRNAIPFVIDLLSLCTEAGLDFMGAIQRVVEKAKPSPLIDELKTVLQELKLGSTRAESLRNMATRVNMTEVSSIVSVLVTADQMGASISTVLRAQSEQIRNERFIRAEKAGAKAAQKILFPLIFFIVPAVFIVVLGPMIAKFLHQFFFAGGASGILGGL